MHYFCNALLPTLTAREKPLKRRRLFTSFLVSVDDGIDGVAEQTRWHKRGVHEEDPVLLFHIGQGQPKMPLRRHQSCHGPPNGTGGLLGGAES